MTIIHRLALVLALLVAPLSADPTLLARSELGRESPRLRLEAELVGPTWLRLDGEGGDLDLVAGTRRANGVLPDEELFLAGDGSVAVEVRWASGPASPFVLEARTGVDGGEAVDGAHLTLAEGADFGWWRLPEVEGPALSITLAGLTGPWFVLDAKYEIIAAPTTPSCTLPLDAGPCWLVLARPDEEPGVLGWKLALGSVSLTEQDVFLAALGATDDQRAALEAFRRQPDGRAMLRYLAEYPGGYPLSLVSEPGLTIRGVERFGGYDGSARQLIVNPTKQEHVDNPMELLDTVAHELLHAILDLPRKDGYPFRDDVLDSQTDPRLRPLHGLLSKRRIRGPLRRYLEDEYGDGISDPEREYIDINAAAQEVVIKIVEDALETTGVGTETQVFENARERNGGQ